MLVLMLMFVFLLVFLLLLLQIQTKNHGLSLGKIVAISWESTLDVPSLDFSLSFDLLRLWLLLSSSCLNIPGSKLDTLGPEPPGKMPGSDTELSEQNSVLSLFASGCRVSVSISVVSLFSVCQNFQ